MRAIWWGTKHKRKLYNSSVLCRWEVHPCLVLNHTESLKADFCALGVFSFSSPGVSVMAQSSGLLPPPPPVSLPSRRPARV